VRKADRRGEKANRNKVKLGHFRYESRAGKKSGEEADRRVEAARRMSLATFAKAADMPDARRAAWPIERA
jgi:hypothetical protein